MHPKNLHNTPYDFDKLIVANPNLSDFVIINAYNKKTIDFANSNAVFELNKAILINQYNLTDWNIPKGYLCPPIPSRADYIHYLADLIATEKTTKNIKGLDIGVGANCIYPILGSRIFNWNMVGADINEKAILSAQQNVNATADLKNYIDIRYQQNNADIFNGIIDKEEFFDFTMCNPPFHNSEKEATKGTLRKLKNLGVSENFSLNFGGQANELWCNGGEALFIKRMIKQSVTYKTQVNWFTCLVSKNEHLKKIYKQLDKLKATHKTVVMTQGNKKSRFVAWKFDNNG